MKRLTLKVEGLSSEFFRVGTGISDWERLESGLRVAGILAENEHLVEYADCESWHRGGAETYVADAKIRVREPGPPIQRRTTKHVIAKAIVSIAPDIDAKVAVLLRRRQVISAIGIAVPFLYFSKDGVLIEEFIDRPLSRRDFKVPAILRQLGEIAARLDFKGFSTLSFVDDLRIKNCVLYYVDFGFDLGEPEAAPTNRAQATLVNAVPRAFIEPCLLRYASVFRKLALPPEISSATV